MDFPLKSQVRIYNFVKMIERILNINNELSTSVFLFGARQTGKSTFLRSQLRGTLYYDLLDTKVRKRLQRDPSLLYESLKKCDEGAVVVIDEIPEVPELLNEVHRLISERNIRFVLCGSSARKLKRKGHNTLGGRAYPLYFYPLVSAEIPEFDIDHAVNVGMLPNHYLAQNPTRSLAGYIDVYLKEEIKEESLVRNLGAFQRFLEVAAQTDGEMVNYNNIAQDCGISATTISEYFDILEDTLVGYRISAYTRTNKRRVTKAPRFYFFDVGVVNYLLNRPNLVRGTIDYGHAFEHLVIQEIIAYLGYTHSREKLTYWRTYTGLEVDAVLGDARVAIEIKSAEEVQGRHLKGLKAFGDEFPDSRRIIVSLDVFNRDMGDIECLYVMDFFKQLWEGKIV